MTFRAQATADLEVFTNTDEFGDSVDIDGVAVACVVEGNGDTPATQDGVIDQDTYNVLAWYGELARTGYKGTA